MYLHETTHRKEGEIDGRRVSSRAKWKGGFTARGGQCYVWGELLMCGLHHRSELIPLDGLLLHEEVCKCIQDRPLRHKDLVGPLMSLGDQGVHLTVDIAAGFLADLQSWPGQCRIQEEGGMALFIGLGAKRLAHAILQDHAAGDVRGPRQIILGAGQDHLKDQLLGCPPPP